MTQHQSSAVRRRGFTLIEMVVVMTLIAICSAVLAVFIRPALQAYLDVQARAALVDSAQTALRVISQDVRVAVPNSIRTPSPLCVEAIPTSSGGSYRLAGDPVNDTPTNCSASSTCSAPLNTATSTSVFDVLSTLQTPPQVGDWVVIANQSPLQVYAGTNRAAVTGVSTPRSTDGTVRVAIAATQFPLGYADGRFVVVPGNTAAVTLVCDGADGTVDAQGNGKGTLYRRSNYGFSATFAACPTGASLAGAAVIARQVKSCAFTYSPNQGSTAQNGFLSLQIDLAKNNETVSLVNGVHVANAP